VSAAGASQAKNQALLKSGDGGGIISDMETRLAKLEATYEDTRSTLNTILGQLARMDAKLDSKPDQGWIVNMICIVLGVVLASIAATAGVISLIR
jgi:hypothetical protein